MKKLLIVEDDPIVAHVYKGRLEKEGYEIAVANDGQSGFYRAHEFEPDAVLLDLMLPKINGIGVLKKLRAEPKFRTMPILVFTNAYLPNTVSECFLAGATLVFNKASTTPKAVLDALRSFLSDDSTGPASAPSNEPETLVAQVEHSLAGQESKARVEHNPPSRARMGAESSLCANPEVMAFVEEKEADDSEFQADLLKSFLESIPEAVASLRKTTQDFIRASDETSRSSLLESLFRKVHGITGGAGIAGLQNLSKTASALEVLIGELMEKPKHLNASTIRTIANAIDTLSELGSKGAEGDAIDQSALEILVVDDEILSRRAITYALGKAGLQSTALEDAEAALSLAGEKSFDLIFLDVQMGSMDGFDLCKKIHLSLLNQNTPVIFVTSLTDFKSRAKSSLSGGSDLIAKPFMFIELTVKALTYLLRRSPPNRARATRPGSS